MQIQLPPSAYGQGDQTNSSFWAQLAKQNDIMNRESYNQQEKFKNSLDIWKAVIG